MAAVYEPTKDWLAGVLPEGGYTDVRFGSRDPEVVVADHPSRPNITLKIRRDLGIIAIMHSWRMKKTGWGQGKDVLAAINKANAVTWLNNFTRDDEGDLLVTSYVTLTEGMAGRDVLLHLEREASQFRNAISASDLAKWIA
jgi:hypothetical protein